ncbi:MAG: endonuclease/exonuclease/phosphatase family protein, partial [Acidimicrobiia bacterium]|nr:endonuclease/exonuclease/phosphatase family protein [Acidimicrobiia bacterium]
MKWRKSLTLVTVAALALAVLPAAAMAAPPEKAGPPEEVRFATFNASLNRFNAGDLAAELSA